MSRPPARNATDRLCNRSAGGSVPTAFENLWDEAQSRPDRPVIGVVPDGAAGSVGCAVQVCGREAVIVLDFPADHLLEAITGLTDADGWHTIDRSARHVRRPQSGLRYILTLERREPVEALEVDGL